MKERPILFSGPMVRAILDGKKTQTRRVMFKDGWEWHCHNPWKTSDGWQDGDDPLRCPYGQPGDRLWVRETWQARSLRDLEWNVYKPIEREGYQPGDWRVRYAATDENFAEWSGWNPSIFMPRWASRLLLENVAVRVERLQDISDADILAEGFPEDPPSYAEGFAAKWNEINPKYPWESNPWVWVVEFKRICEASR